ncbi:MAG: cobalamin-dependent protein [Bacilli bacterium]|jgi:methanogenic corrinoid protein MtbC1|nr:cobalamin-dependent protein [Bacilli bacterium]
MKEQYEQFIQILEKENKDEAVSFVMELLEKDQITIEDLYNHLLGPALWNFHCQSEDQEICIWKEHARTSIIRTILECTYPYISKRRKSATLLNKKVVVFCPSEEYHEIGAIMVNHAFLLAGLESQYIGANTPKYDIYSAVRILKPDYVAISVTNYYNVVITKQITERLKQDFPQIKILIGGQAFKQIGAKEQVQYDQYLESLDDIDRFGKEVAK